jgi:hypothetical protein
MEKAGNITAADAAGILDELQCREEEGTFHAGYTGFLVWGRNPD